MSVAQPCTIRVTRTDDLRPAFFTLESASSHPFAIQHSEVNLVLIILFCNIFAAGMIFWSLYGLVAVLKWTFENYGPLATWLCTMLLVAGMFILYNGVHMLVRCIHNMRRGGNRNGASYTPLSRAPTTDNNGAGLESQDADGLPSYAGLVQRDGGQPAPAPAPAPKAGTTTEDGTSSLV